MRRRTLLIVVATTLADVAIVSEQLQGEPGKGFEVLRELRVAVPGTRTVMLFDTGNRDLVVEAFRSGARGVFCRQETLRCSHGASIRCTRVSCGSAGLSSSS